MSGQSAPADRSVELRQLELDSADKQRARDAETAAARKSELAGLRSGAGSSAREQASSYFAGRGQDPDKYASSIQNKINALMNGISPDDPNPGSYFSNIGEQVYGDEENKYRAKEMGALDDVFSPNFEYTRIKDTMDDPYLGAIEGEQFNNADAIIRNMVERGVITNTGYDAAHKNLEGQRAGAKGRLNAIGSTALEGGRQQLRDVSNRARSTASQLKLGQGFDPYQYGSDVDTQFMDFLNNFDTNLRGKAPNDLFSTAGLGAIAGAGSGAQNTKFNSKALNGIIEPDDEQNNRVNNSANPF